MLRVHVLQRRYESVIAYPISTLSLLIFFYKIYLLHISLNYLTTTGLTLLLSRVQLVAYPGIKHRHYVRNLPTSCA
jgi:hypothetical protein